MAFGKQLALRHGAFNEQLRTATTRLSFFQSCALYTVSPISIPAESSVQSIMPVIYVWRKKYGEMDVSDVKRLKELEAENRKLKEIVAEQALDNKALKYLLSKNL